MTLAGKARSEYERKLQELYLARSQEKNAAEVAKINAKIHETHRNFMAKGGA